MLTTPAAHHTVVRQRFGEGANINSVMNSTPAPSLLLLIRHAEQQTLRELDPPLSERGQAQADRLANRLSAIPLIAIASSPMARARATAKPLAERLGLAVEIVDDLAEANLTAEQNRHVFTNTSARHMEPNADDYVGPTQAAVEVLPRFQWGRDGCSETGEHLRTRVTDALDEVMARNPGGIVACFSHGGAINAATGRWLGIERDMWFVPWHAGITAILIDDDKRTILFVNDSSHLEGGQDAISVMSSSFASLS